MTNKRKLFIGLFFLSIPLLVKLPINVSAKSAPFHTELELSFFQSAKDPFWRAKVSHEVILYPQHQQVIETKCTSCHAPMGHFAAMHNGQQYYSMAEALGDSIALDGVSCLACHQQGLDNLGDLNSGHLNFDTTKVAYGPYISPLESPMVMASEYQPVYSEHISDAGICAGCHTLITETLDYDGNFTGTNFVEQATYHEWLNSTYEASDVSCQSCHMDAISKGQILIAAGFETEPRSPFYLHTLSGANVFMLQIFRDNIEALGLAASEEQFDQAIAATEDMLFNRSINMDLSFLERTADTAFFEVNIANLAGHKFPSGYPSRRVFIEFVVENEYGDTLFISGKTDDTFEVLGHNADYEPHYDVIRSEDEVQIYEMVVADANDNVTTVLVRGEYALKDNRIPPLGFESTHSTYDTVMVAGLANTDLNFNKEDSGTEGTGADKIYYNIPMNGDFSTLDVTAKVYYQTAPPKWMEELFAETSEEIDAFRVLFDAADRQPILIKETALEVESFISSAHSLETNAFAKVVSTVPLNQTIQVQSEEEHAYSIYDLNGTLIRSNASKVGNYTITLKNSSGIYIIHFTNKHGITNTEKIILN